jgi:hypothetical protein
MRTLLLIVLLLASLECHAIGVHYEAEVPGHDGEQSLSEPIDPLSALLAWQLSRNADAPHWHVVHYNFGYRVTITADELAALVTDLDAVIASKPDMATLWRAVVAAYGTDRYSRQHLVLCENATAWDFCKEYEQALLRGETPTLDDYPHLREELEWVIEGGMTDFRTSLQPAIDAGRGVTLYLVD